MSKANLSEYRRIIDDFAQEIKRSCITGAKPEKTVIRFREDQKNQTERFIVEVPIELLRYRGDNGRISSDVQDYIRRIGPINEASSEGQLQLGEFLKKKDPEKSKTLHDSLRHAGQTEPAIITCDGFLVNGNRRRMVFDELHREDPGKYRNMRVVILPDGSMDGDPKPTLFDIEELENRYQFQKDGKAEYYGFDRALSIKLKMERGMDLATQLSDDPSFVNLSAKELKKAEEELRKEYLDPLDCIDRYLDQFGLSGQYSFVSSGAGDSEGRWQAFKDFSNSYSRIKDPAWQATSGLASEDVQTVEEAAFNIMRLRVVPNTAKLHMIMRDIPKYCKNDLALSQLKSLASDVTPVPKAELVDDKGTTLSSDKIQDKWIARNKQVIISCTIGARKALEAKQERETPMALLQAALNKLRHHDLMLDGISITDWDEAATILREIQKEANSMEHEIYGMKKGLDGVAGKKH